MIVPGNTNHRDAVTPVTRPLKIFEKEYFMAKSLYIAEKPSVAQEFAKALKMNARRQDGYLESDDAVVTWCVGHLITMSYPEKYGIKRKYRG